MAKRTKHRPSHSDTTTDEQPTNGQKEHTRRVRQRKTNGVTDQGSQRRYSKSDFRVETDNARGGSRTRH